MFKSGEMVAHFIEPRDGGELDDKQIQPNGVDLTVGTLKKMKYHPGLKDDKYTEPNFVEADRVEPDGDYVMYGDKSYKVVYGEKITIPNNHIGIVFPRSRLLRSCIHLNTALWDSGYSGIGEGALFSNGTATIEDGMRIGQMCFVRASNYKSYDGNFNMERVDPDG